MMQRWTLAVALGLMFVASQSAVADDYPSRPIKAIASQGPGGLSDLFMRALGEQMGPALGTSIVVEDRIGAEGTVGAKACADSAPDGYTICILPGETIVINPLIQPSDFDPAQRLVPIARPYYLTQVFAVSASLNVKSFDELAAAAKAKPKTFNYMAPSLSKVAFMEEFNKKNGTDIVRIPFKGGGDAVTAMLTGTAQVAIFGIGNLVAFLRDGKIRGLAIDGDVRSPLAPEIPTFKESGYKEHIAATFFGIFAPAGTPQPIVDKLNKAIVAVESKPDFQERFLINRGLTPVLTSAEQFAKELPADRAEGRAVVKASGLYPDVK
ncbi:MAG TPA: tripartite tricarboxylate transporter substrate binding protein [Xanthobacteraceae bacterium]|nr:tripartite tricarboxylate transporter substrate binding protein [Xanthobacteraceae bacterium]